MLALVFQVKQIGIESMGGGSIDNNGGGRTILEMVVLVEQVRYIRLQRFVSRASSSHIRGQENSADAISLLESKHADCIAAGRGSYVHAMAMTKTTREADP